MELLESRLTPSTATVSPPPQAPSGLLPSGVNDPAVGTPGGIIPIVDSSQSGFFSTNFNPTGMPGVGLTPNGTAIAGQLTPAALTNNYFAVLQAEELDPRVFTSRFYEDDELATRFEVMQPLPSVTRSDDVYLAVLLEEEDEEDDLFNMDPATVISGALTDLENQVAISGFVYVDANGNRRYDAEERGVPRVTVVLSGVDNQGRPVERRTLTGADGFYMFEGLPPGQYTIRVLGADTEPVTVNTESVPPGEPLPMVHIAVAPATGPAGNNGEHEEEHSDTPERPENEQSDSQDMGTSARRDAAPTDEATGTDLALAFETNSEEDLFLLGVAELARDLPAVLMGEYPLP